MTVEEKTNTKEEKKTQQQHTLSAKKASMFVIRELFDDVCYCQATQ